MTRPLLLCGCLAAVLLFVGCDSNEPTVDEPTPSVLPLAVGNQWVLERTETQIAPGTSDTTFFVRRDTIRIERDTTLAGERWFVIDNFFGFQGLYAQRADGIWHKPLNSPAAEPILRYKQPANVGEQYPISLSPGQPDDIRVTVRSKDTIRITEAGSIASYQYERSVYAIAIQGSPALPITDAPLVLNTYLAPGVGFVEAENVYVRYNSEETAFVSAGREEHWQLISYQLSE